jgi:hypothetical protein
MMFPTREGDGAKLANSVSGTGISSVRGGLSLPHPHTRQLPMGCDHLRAVSVFIDIIGMPFTPCLMPGRVEITPGGDGRTKKVLKDCASHISVA